ncbi:MAG: DUF4493 domain-containing protein [Muribaculaceae bacterium]|nr:DUF4493 domain-containing protein [Muribaculaceae bacterium]
MKNIAKMAAIVALTTTFTACEEQWDPDQLLQENGSIDLSALTIDVDGEITEMARSAEAVDVNAFTVTILDETTGAATNQWTVANMPEIVTLPVGTYIIDVENGPLQAAAWDAPWYHNTSKVTVQKDEVAYPSPITCKLSNVMVSVAYSEALRQALDPDANVVVLVNPEAPLTYTLNETRTGYFALPEGASTLVAEFSGKVNGREVTLRKSFGDIAVGQHHTITFSLKAGQLDPSIIIDADITYDDVDIDIPGNDDPIIPPTPSEDLPTITSETLDLEGVNQVTEDLQAVVNIKAPNGISHLWVTIISDGLTADVLQEVGLTDKFDLAYPGEYEEPLQGLGFPTGESVIGQTDLIFDISEFVPLLPLFPGNHHFVLDVEDAKGNKVSVTLKFYAEAI